MTRFPFRFLPAALAAALVCATLGPMPSACAQAPEGPDTTESTTEDSTGLVTGVSPYSTITVSDRKGPFTYRLGQDLHILGPDNRPLKITDVRTNDEVTVFYYYRDGHPTVKRLVVLRRGNPSAKRESAVANPLSLSAARAGRRLRRRLLFSRVT